MVKEACILVVTEGLSHVVNGCTKVKVFRRYFIKGLQTRFMFLTTYLHLSLIMIGWKNSAFKVWIWGQMCGHSLPKHQHGRARPGLNLGGSSYLWIRRHHHLHGALKVTHRRPSPTFCPAQRALALICARFTLCLQHVLQRGTRLLSLVWEDAPGQLSPCTTTTEPVLLSPCSSTREATAARSPCTAAPFTATGDNLLAATKSQCTQE